MNMTTIEKSTGILQGARYIPSPNFNARPEHEEISLLVIHNISLPPGEFSGDFVQAFFLNKLDTSQHPYFEQIAGLKVSSHLYIRRSGELWQFVPLHKRAWHSGESSYLNKSNCNDYSIGIELEGNDTHAYTEEQYLKLAGITSTILKLYPAITLERIVGHSDIAPLRKTDPGPSFEWDHYKKLVSKLLAD
jgi:AmpD protein